MTDDCCAFLLRAATAHASKVDHSAFLVIASHSSSKAAPHACLANGHHCVPAPALFAPTVHGLSPEESQTSCGQPSMVSDLGGYCAQLAFLLIFHAVHGSQIYGSQIYGSQIYGSQNHASAYHLSDASFAFLIVATFALDATCHFSIAPQDRVYFFDFLSAQHGLNAHDD